MDEKEFYGTVVFSVEARLAPWNDPSEYVHTISGRATVVNDEDTDDVVGSIVLKLVSATEAINRGHDLLTIFDADSSLLEHIYSTLFDVNEEPREELDIETCWNNLLFVEDMAIDPKYQATTLRVQLVATATAMFCPEGLVVAAEDSLDLTIEDWRALGFKRIAKSPFVYLDQLKLNPYDRKGRPGTPTDDLGEARYVCNACGEDIVIPIDLSQGAIQEYVEDCPVCCRPNVIHVSIDENGISSVWAEPEQDFE